MHSFLSSLWELPQARADKGRGQAKNSDRTGSARIQRLVSVHRELGRSVMAECAINRWGRGKFRGFSAGSHPKGEIHPMTLALLSELNYETSGLRSKSWDEFAQPGSPLLDFVFTVCDNAAKEACPNGRGSQSQRIGAPQTWSNLSAVTNRNAGSFSASTPS
jgi:hypothetical protein